MFNRIRKAIETIRGKPTPKPITALELATRPHSDVKTASRSETKERLRKMKRKAKVERLLREKGKKR